MFYQNLQCLFRTFYDKQECLQLHTFVKLVRLILCTDKHEINHLTLTYFLNLNQLPSHLINGTACQITDQNLYKLVESQNKP